MPAVLLSPPVGVRLVFMSSELLHPGLPIKTPKHGNLMTFPRGLRDAIPDMPTCVGRVLELSSMTGDAIFTFWGGRQVHLDLLVKETGRLTGEFRVTMDLQPDAARALAVTLNELADR